MIKFQDGNYISALTVHRQTDAAFKRFCAEFDVTYRCIKEGIDGDCYEVEFQFLSDIYGLGQAVGADSLIEFQNRNE